MIMAFCPICLGQHDPDIACTDATGQAIRDMRLPRALRRPRNGASPNTERPRRGAALWVLAIGGVFLLIIWLLRGGL